jgi:hypothetical protein
VLRAGLALVSVVSVIGVAAVAAAPPDDAACKTQTHSVIVDLDNVKHRHILDHAWDAQRGDEQQSIPSSRDGEPEVRLMHWDPADATKHRAASLKGIPTKPGYDRDEVPPAASREGGKGADVRYVGSAENRSAGSVMGAQLRPYCTGQAFRFEPRP